MLPRAVQAVVFDMDGLLVDTEVAARDSFYEATARHGHDVPPEVYTRMIGSTGAASRQFLTEHFGPSVDIDLFWGSWEAGYVERMAAGVQLKAGVREVLDALDRLGLPRAIATSSPHHHVKYHLDHHGLHERFDAVLARGDYARSKPSPDPFLAAAERLGVEPAHCLALEDSHNGVRAAAAAGMMTIMVPDLLDPDEELRGLCVAVAESLHHVRELLERRG